MPPEDGLITRERFTEYMDGFKRDLTDQFSLREACKLRHDVIDTRLNKGDGQFRILDDRLRAVEKRIYIALGVFAAFQWALQSGWLKFL